MFTTETSVILPIMIAIFIVALLLFFIIVELCTFVLFQERYFWLSHYEQTRFNEKKALHPLNDTDVNQVLYNRREYHATQSSQNPFSNIMKKQVYHYELAFSKKRWHRHRIAWITKGGERFYDDAFQKQ